MDSSKRISKAESGYLSESEITETHSKGGYTNSPVETHLSEEEYIKSLSPNHGAEIKEGDNKIEPIESYGEAIYCITNKQVILIMPKRGKDKVERIKYTAIDSVDYLKKTSFFGGNKYGVKITTDKKSYELWVNGENGRRDEYRLRVLLDTLREEINRDYEFVLTSPQYDSRASIEILDRETGEAKMESKGWNYGLGFVQRTKSEATIEKEGYEMNPLDIALTSDGILLEGIDPNHNSSVTIRRPYEKIGAMDAISTGAIIYSSDGIYKISDEFKSEKRYTILQNKIRSKLDNNIQDNDTKETQSNLEKIEKLDELRSEGVITEDEFEQKKQELLEDI